MTHTDPGHRPGGSEPRDPYASHPGDHHYSAEELHNADVAHEPTDVNVRKILMFALGLATVAAVVHVIVWVVFIGLERQAAKSDPPISPLAVPAAQMPRTTTGSPYFGAASGTKLLTNEPSLLQEERKKEADALKGIGDAKKAVMGQLPVRAGGPVDERLGTHLPASGESSGGRTIVLKTAPAPGTPVTPAQQPPGGQAPSGTHKGQGRGST